MTRMHSSLTAVFEAYGDDAQAGLAALANTDPPFWSAYTDSAAERQYRSDHARYRRSLLTLVDKDAIARVSGQPRLFDVPEGESLVQLRSVLVLDGVQYDIGGLAGATGASVLRGVAQRDLAPATTVVNRCRIMLRLADHIEAETSRLSRDVTVAEVLSLAAA